MQVEERRFRSLDATVFPQVEIEVALHPGLELIQFEPAQLAIEIVLNGSLTDTLGERADGRADFDAQQRLAHNGRIALAEQRHGGVLQFAQCGQRILHAGHGLGEPDTINDLGGGPECAGGTQFASDAGQKQSGQSRRCVFIVGIPDQLEIGGCVVARAVAGLRRQLEKRIRHQRHFGLAATQFGEFLIGYRGRLRPERRRMKRTGDHDDLLGVDAIGNGLRNFPAHVGFAHQILDGVTRGEVFHRAQFLAIAACGVQVSVVGAKLFEVAFPISFVVWFAGEASDLVIDGIALGLLLNHWSGFGIRVVVDLIRLRFVVLLLRFLLLENRCSVITIHQAEKDGRRQIHEACFGLVPLTPNERLIFRAISG